MIPVNNLEVNDKATRGKNFNLREIETRVKCGILSAAMLVSLGVEAHAVESTNSTQDIQQTQTLSQLDELIAKTMTKSDRESFNNLEIKTGIPIYVNDELSAPVEFNGVVGVPFILDGVTYLPVRDICKMFNVNIKWISAYESVLIDTTTLSTIPTNPNKVTSLPTTMMKKVNGTKNVNVYVYNGNDLTKLNITQKGYKELASQYVINGTTYLPVRTLADLFGIPITYDNGVRIGTHVKTVSPVVTPTTPTSTLVYPNLSDELNTKLNKYYNLVIHIQPYMDEVDKLYRPVSDINSYSYNKLMTVQKLLKTNNSSELQNYYSELKQIDTKIANLMDRFNAMISSSQLASIKLRFDKIPKTVTEADYYGKYGSLEDLINFCTAQLESFDSDLAYIRTNCTDSIIKNYYSQIDTIYNAAMKSVKITSNTVNNTETEGYSYIIEKTYDPIA